MAEPVSPPAKPPVDYETVELFLAELRREGLRVGPREEIATARLMAELLAKGAVKAPADLRPFLQPLLARNAEDAARFARVFRAWFEDGKAAPRAVPIIPPARGERTGGWFAPIAGVALLLAAVVTAWLVFSQPPAPALVAPPPPVVTPSPPPPSGLDEPAPADMADVDGLMAAVVASISQAGPGSDFAPTLREIGDHYGYDGPAAAIGGLPADHPLPVLTDSALVVRVAYGLAQSESPSASLPSHEALRDALSRNPILASPEDNNATGVAYRIANELGGAQAQRLRDILRARGVTGGEAPSLTALNRLIAAPAAEAVDKPFRDAIQRGLALWNWRHPDRAVMFDDPDLLDDTPPWLPASDPGMPLWMPAAAAVIPFLLLVFWLMSSVERRKAFLRRRAPDYPPALHDLVAQVSKAAQGAETFLRQASQRLQQWSLRESTALDVPRTLESSIANGRLTLVRSLARSQPAYLVLIESAGAGDQNAARMRGLIRQLENRHISADVFYYQGHPTWLHPERWGAGDSDAPFATPPLHIEDLVQRFAGHRLVVMGEGDLLIDPARGEPTPAARHLSSWPARALLTPRPIAEWGAREFAIAQQLDLPVGRATSAGLVPLARLLGLDGADLRGDVSFDGDGRARPMPRELRERLDRWTTDLPASTVSWTELQDTLRKYLDTDAYTWLCGCAVYPELRWDLTLFLGLTVKRADGTPIYDESRLGALTQLPWFRLGRMPDWLRARLIGELGPQAQSIRSALAQIVEAARASSEPAGADAVKLRIATARPGAEDVMDDQIFLEFLAKGQSTDLEVSALQGLKKLAPKPLREAFEKTGILVALFGALAIAIAVLMAPIGGKASLLDIYGRLDGWRSNASIIVLWITPLPALLVLLIVDRHALRIPVERSVPGWLLVVGDVGFAALPMLFVAAVSIALGGLSILDGYSSISPVTDFTQVVVPVGLLWLALFPAVLIWRYRARRIGARDLAFAALTILAVSTICVFVFGGYAETLPYTFVALLALGLLAFLIAAFGERFLSREATWQEMSRWRARRPARHRPLLSSVSAIALLGGSGAYAFTLANQPGPTPPGAGRADVTASRGDTLQATPSGLWKRTDQWRNILATPEGGAPIVQLLSSPTGCIAATNAWGDVIAVSQSGGAGRTALPGSGMEFPAPLLAFNTGAGLLAAQIQSGGEDRLFVLTDACGASSASVVAETPGASRSRITHMAGSPEGYVLADSAGRILTVRTTPDGQAQLAASTLRFDQQVVSINHIDFGNGSRTFDIRSVSGELVTVTWNADGALSVISDGRIRAEEPVVADPTATPEEQRAWEQAQSSAAAMQAFIAAWPNGAYVTSGAAQQRLDALSARPNVTDDPRCADYKPGPLSLKFSDGSDVVLASVRQQLSDAVAIASEGERDECFVGLIELQGYATQAEAPALADAQALGLRRAQAIELVAKSVAGATPAWTNAPGYLDPVVRADFLMVHRPSGAVTPPVVPRLAASDPGCEMSPFTNYFEWDRSDLTTVNREVVTAAVQRARSISGCEIAAVQIVGHTDSNGSAVYNQRLSERIAATVRQALIADGVRSELITTYGVGESDPAEPRPDDTREPLNRRAETTIRLTRTPTQSLSPPPPPPAPTPQEPQMQACAIQPSPFVVYFEWDRSDLTSANRDTINAAVQRAKAGGCRITMVSVEGHTDSSNTSDYNDRLSARMADTVKAALIAAGVSESVITTVAKGESEPAEPRPDGTREPLNRRAEVLITIGR